MSAGMLKLLMYAAIPIICYLLVRRAAAKVDLTDTDFVIESIELDPPDGSTVFEQTPIHATIRFRFVKPPAELGIWVRIFDETYRSQFFGSPDRFAAGTHTVVRGAYLVEPGVLNQMTVVVKNHKSTEIFRQDIPVNYTFVRDPALESRKADGEGSTITSIDFPKGKRATVKKGSFIPVDVRYDVNTPRGLFAGTIPDTKCSMTYAGLAEPLIGEGEIGLGFTIGEACKIERVRVMLRNEAEGVIYEEYVDVDLTITD
jgi:hypothetical protein